MLRVCLTHATHTSALAPDEAAGRMPSSRAGVWHEGPFSRPFLNDCQPFADESMIAPRALRGAEQRGWEVTCRSSVLPGVRRTRRRPPSPAGLAGCASWSRVIA